MSDELDQAVADLRECDETQGGVLRALRVIAGEVRALRAAPAKESGRRAELLARLDDVTEGRWSTWNLFAYDQEHGLERAAMCDAQEAVKLAAAASAYPATTTVDVVFDGPPGPTSGRFVEVETVDGASICAGEWVDRGDGMWALRVELASA